MMLSWRTCPVEEKEEEKKINFAKQEQKLVFIKNALSKKFEKGVSGFFQIYSYVFFFFRVDLVAVACLSPSTRGGGEERV